MILILSLLTCCNFRPFKSNKNEQLICFFCFLLLWLLDGSGCFYNISHFQYWQKWWERGGCMGHSSPCVILFLVQNLLLTSFSGAKIKLVRISVDYLEPPIQNSVVEVSEDEQRKAELTWPYSPKLSSSTIPPGLPSKSHSAGYHQLSIW